MKQNLLEKYPGQYAGIYEGELIAVNPDKMELITEIRREMGNVRVLIQKIVADEPRIRLPVSRKLFDISE